jgi:hypothetical protein
MKADPRQEPQQHTRTLGGDVDVIHRNPVPRAFLNQSPDDCRPRLRLLGANIVVVMRCARDHRELMASGTQVHREIADELRGRHAVRGEHEREDEYVSHVVIVNRGLAPRRSSPRLSRAP